MHSATRSCAMYVDGTRLTARELGRRQPVGGVIDCGEPTKRGSHAGSSGAVRKAHGTGASDAPGDVQTASAQPGILTMQEGAALLRQPRDRDRRFRAEPLRPEDPQRGLHGLHGHGLQAGGEAHSRSGHYGGHSRLRGRHPLPDSSEDFIVCSHVLGHVVDRVRRPLEWDQIIKQGGTIFMIIPHKERTVDARRSRTALAHLVEDYEAECMAPSVSEGGHEHVWVTEDIVELVLWMQTNTGVSWRLLEVADTDDKVGNGFTIVIRKMAERSFAAPVALP
jgi:hypothetical protein